MEIGVCCKPQALAAQEREDAAMARRLGTGGAGGHFDDDAALERRVTQRITLKAKGREHEVARRRLRDLKMETEEAERAIAKEGHREGKHEGEGKEKHHTLHHAKSFRSKKPNIRGKTNKQE